MVVDRVCFKHLFTFRHFLLEGNILISHSRLTTNLVATTSKSLDNIIAEARRELAEERCSSTMTTSAESLYTSMAGPLASSSSAPSGYPDYLAESKNDYLDMDKLTAFVSATLK